MYGAPPLLSEKAQQGEHDATLTFWNFCADLEGKGFRRAIEMGGVMRELGAKGPVAIVGYTFDGAWAARNRGAVDRFLDATRQAKQILAESESEWQRLAPRIGVSDARRFRSTASATARASCAARSPRRRPTPARSIRCWPRSRGAELVGPARELAPGTFYRPAAAE